MLRFFHNFFPLPLSLCKFELKDAATSSGHSSDGRSSQGKGEIFFELVYFEFCWEMKFA